MISNKAGLQHIAELFIREGIEHIVISPGSRNAPMMLTFPEYKEFTIYSIVDERSAGFFALGLAQKLKKPVVLNCTSGSALLNYAPALAEAYYQNIPLIVLSADRPDYLIDQGDGQTIRQKSVFYNYIRKSVHLPENLQSDNNLQIFQEYILEAIAASQFPVKGPVHINVPMDEPIYGTQEKALLQLLPKTKYQASKKIQSAQKTELQDIWNTTTKKMIIIGQHDFDPQLDNLLQSLAERNDLIILSESTSNIKEASSIEHIDQVLMQVNSENENSLFPDLLISLGGHIVSKKIKAWLRKKVEYQHWHIGLDHKPMDTYFHLTQHIQTSDNAFLEFLTAQKSAKNSNYKELWLAMQNKVQVLHQQYMSKLEFSDLYIFESIRKNLPNTPINLHFSNSTPIRYSQLFKYSKNIIINSNRGVSGIDGSISTALGASMANNGISCIITGDLSFFYDSNALWNNYLHNNFRIIVINNKGGGIFRFIEGPAQSKQLPLFETPHQRSAQSLAEEAKMNYSSCHTAATLQKSLELFFEPSNNAQLLEIFTPQEKNAPILKAYFEFLKNIQ